LDIIRSLLLQIAIDERNAVEPSPIAEATRVIQPRRE